MPSKTSRDCDGLSIKIVKYFISSIVDPLCFIFNKSFTYGIFPTSLKIAKIVPIFKSGDKADIKSYRPISLLSVFSKIFEKFMLIRLSVFFNKYNVLNINQHGFRPNYSICTAVADVLNYVTTALNKKVVALALFFDVFKVFESLDRNMLLKKLEHYGVRGVALNWFNSLLTHRFQFTELVGSRSLLTMIIFGVPQGLTLGPYLYTVYVNDIFYVVLYVKCILYADDTTLPLHDSSIFALINNASTFFSLFLLGLLITICALILKRVSCCPHRK